MPIMSSQEKDECKTSKSDLKEFLFEQYLDQFTLKTLKNKNLNLKKVSFNYPKH